MSEDRTGEPKYDVEIVLVDGTRLSLPRTDLVTAIALVKEIVERGYTGRPRYKKKPVTLLPREIKEVAVKQASVKENDASSR